MTEHLPFPPGRKSPPVTNVMAGKIKSLRKMGLSQQDIATVCGVNQGRVSEVCTGKKFADVPPKQGDLFD